MSTPLPQSRDFRRCWLACCCALAAISCKYPSYTAAIVDACGSYAANTCEALQRCGPALIAPYGSVQGCGVELGDSCVNNLMQPDTLSSSLGVQACGDSLAAISCVDLFNNDLPPTCGVARGKRSDGAECSVSAQCAGGRCDGAGQGVWGKCRELAQLDEACVSFSDCGTGLICGSGGRCIALAALGSPCSEQAPCRAPFECQAGVCQQPPPTCDAACQAAAAPTACKAFSVALCNRLAACASSAISSSYGDLATCTARNTSVCLTRQQTTDVVSSATGLGPCTQLLPNVDCSALLDNALPSGCRYAPGARPDGQSCSDDGQCASTRCSRAADAMCGVCAELAPAEAACNADSDCASGLVCTTDQVCRAPSVMAASCDAAHPCVFPLSCANAHCGAALASGASCDPANDQCDHYASLACSAAPSTCSPWLQAQPGQACGYTSTGWAVCTGGGTCRIASGAIAGSCDTPLADGAACVVGSGPACLTLARCIGGVCRLPSPGECS
jgi:hypothetical protein